MREKKAMIDAHHSTLSIAHQCELIHLSRASYYRCDDLDIGTETPENLELMRLLDEEFTRHPFFGSRKLRSYLLRQGYVIARKRIQRLMRVMGLVSVAPKPNTSKRNKEHKIYPYLLRDLIINRPNQVWCTDITYIRMKGGFVYLAAIMDWYSRKVLSWEVFPPWRIVSALAHWKGQYASMVHLKSSIPIRVLSSLAQILLLF